MRPENSALMVYVSTDFVFDGTGSMYREDDPVNPISYYAYSKLLGEYYVLGLDNYIIARTSVVYGNARRNFVTWVRDSLRSGSTIKVVNDQFNTPTLSIDCAEAIRELVKNCAWGIYHTAGSERVSRYEFARTDRLILWPGRKPDRANYQRCVKTKGKAPQGFFSGHGEGGEVPQNAGRAERPGKNGSVRQAGVNGSYQAHRTISYK